MTEAELDELKKKHEAAFRPPWTYSRWEIECEACGAGTNTPESGECANPDCDGTHAPIVAVESPEEYPDGQLVAQISVPGILSLADANGASITALHNAFPDLERLARFGLKAKALLREYEEGQRFAVDVVSALRAAANALDGGCK